jgi:hypothetical protein
MDSSDRFPAAIWLVARFVRSEQRPDVLDCTDPAAVLAAAGKEIETEIAALVRGHRSAVIGELCLGAIALRELATTYKTWIAVTAPLRAPCCQAVYSRVHDHCHGQLPIIRKVAKALAGAKRMNAAELLWLLDSRQAA